MLVVYTMNLEPLYEQNCFEKLLDTVKKERRTKVLRYKNKKDQARSLGAGLLLKAGLEDCGIRYDTFEIREGLHGKPQALSEDIQYNLSHSGDCAVCSIADAPVGVDIERLDRFDVGADRTRRQCELIAKRCFQEKELFAILAGGKLSGLEADKQGREKLLIQLGLALKNAASDEKECRRIKEQFAEIWTRKESFAKECGRGMSMDFCTIDTQEEACFYSFAERQDYMVSVCGNPKLFESADILVKKVEIVDGGTVCMMN